MSVSVTFQTSKKIEADQIFKELADRGEKIAIISKEFPFLKIGIYLEALRGVEINQKENGYEIRVCSFANRSDLRLFIKIIDTMMGLTGGKALYQNDEEHEIVKPNIDLDEKWIKRQLEESLSINSILVKYFGKPIVMDGILFHFCFGPFLAKSFDLDLSNPSIDKMEELQDYLKDLQWCLNHKNDTSTHLSIINPEDPHGPSLSISLIYAEKGKIKDFDYVSYADVVCLMDKDKEFVNIRMEDFWKILPEKGFFFMDDYQYRKDKKLSYKTFLEMQNRAKLFEVDDLFYKPTFPGCGYDEKQKTYVLMWNPAISSYKMKDHINSIPNILTEHFNWSVYDYQNAKKDDRFVLVRCGEGKTGIVMSGIFDSNPYQGNDWSGRGRRVFYMDMTPNFIADPESTRIITTQDLQKAIPSFDWSGGRSGRLLTEEQAKQLEELISPYLQQFANNVDGITVNGLALPQNNEEELII